LIFAVFYLTNNGLLEASLLIAMMWISDLLDGYVARKRNEVSTLGKIIDPAADKVSIVTISILMFFRNLIPLWFILILIARDVAISIGGIYAKKKTGIVPMSNLTGKVTAFLIGFVLWFVLLRNGLKINGNWELISNLLIFISLVMVVASLWCYSKKFVELIKLRRS